MYISGPVGGGKSHLAAAIANQLLQADMTVAYASVPELMQFLRAGFSDDTTGQRMQALKDVEVLVLDDIGAEQLTPWVDEQLFVMINARYLKERPTIFTSNLRSEAIPARISSRVAELALELVIPVSDYRRYIGRVRLERQFAV